MATYIAGNASKDEKGTYKGGAAGDQKQTSVPDYDGEVKLKKFPGTDVRIYYVFRPKSVNHAYNIACCMIRACNNANIGYAQDTRTQIYTYGTQTATKCNCDCSSLVNQCIREGTNTTISDFSSGTAPSILTNSGLFETKFKYTSTSTLYTGDVLCTTSSGHMLIIVNGNARDGTSNPDLGLISGGLIDSNGVSANYLSGGDLYDTETTRADAIIREVCYWNGSSVTTTSNNLRCSVINYTTQLGAIFKGAIGEVAGTITDISGNSSVDLSGVTSTNLRAIITEFLNLGYGIGATVGISGNIRQESGYDPGAIGKSSKGKAYGLCQWYDANDGSVKNGTNMRNWVGSSWATNISKQLQYLDYQLQTSEFKSLYNNLRACANTLAGAKEAMELFLRGYERPGNYATEITRRNKYVEEIWSQIVIIQ
ncbi:MAG: phage tail tip lysozyme [Oscillospiraceae bacterium]|nr:phage tail tip lysozyme [Oscillospiraceae bacterium]